MSRAAAVPRGRRNARSIETLVTALLITLAHPRTWLLALAAFLIRGGIVWFLVPILILPTPVGLANLLGPSIVDVVFVGLTLGVILLLIAGVGVILLWIFGGGLIAAALELELVREVATDEDLTAAAGASEPPIVPAGRTMRVLIVRLVALAPLLIAVVFGATRIVEATYAELTFPGEGGTSIAWRVLGDVPDALVLIAITWLLGEIIGGLAARRIGLGEPSMVRALWGALVELARHPVRTLVLFSLPTIGLLVVLVPAVAASSAAWSAVRDTLGGGGSGPLAALALVAFVGLWAGGLVLAGGACAWRHAAWTVAAVLDGRGTFGGSATGRPGDWNVVASSGTV